MKKVAFQISQIFALLILFNSVAVAQDKFPQLHTKIFLFLNKKYIYFIAT